MSRPPEEFNPWGEVGQQPVRMPEKLTPKQTATKTLGFVLMGLGGIGIVIFAYLYFGLSTLVQHHVPFHFSLGGLTSYCLWYSKKSPGMAVALFVFGNSTITCILYVIVYNKPVARGVVVRWEDLAAILVTGALGFAFSILGYKVFKRR